MTKKHFQAIASGLFSSKPEGIRLGINEAILSDGPVAAVWADSVVRLSMEFIKINPRFSASRFFRACVLGYDKAVKA